MNRRNFLKCSLGLAAGTVVATKTFKLKSSPNKSIMVNELDRCLPFDIGTTSNPIVLSEDNFGEFLQNLHKVVGVPRKYLG